MIFKRFEKPILTANPENDWESLVTTNPTAWYDEETKEVIMVYRAAGNDSEHIIHLGLAKSKDGIHFERVFDKPILSPSTEGNFDGGSVEDPRIVKFGDWYFLTYACIQLAPGQYWLEGLRRTDKTLPDEAPWILKTNNTRTGLAITKDFKKIYRAGYLTDATVDDRDVILFPEKINGKFYLLHRPVWYGEGYPCAKPSMWISSCDDLLENKNYKLLAQPRDEYSWEYWKIGGSAQPIKTEHGWFVTYHGVGEDGRYRVGAMILDLNNPEKVLYRTKQPILEPMYDYECEGIYKGICFPCGNVVIDGKLYVYYGAADQHVGVAICDFNEFIETVMKDPV